MTSKAKIESLQVLRGLAASMVVLHHTIRAVLLFSSSRHADATMTVPWAADWLAIGVDIFFVLSGFIMVYISPPYLAGKKPLYDFAAMRLIRIYPLYLAATVLLLILQTVSFALYTGAGFNLNFRRIFSALLLYPTYNEKGLVQPVLGVGWTLSYEVLFYTICLIAIAFSRKIKFEFTVIMLIVLAHLLSYMGNSNYNALESFLHNRIMFEFILGCFIAVSLNNGLLQRLPTFGLAITFVFLLLISFSTHSNSDNRFISWGLTSAALVLFLVRVEQRGFRYWPKLLDRLGEASYSIYIFHTLILYLILVPLMEHLRLNPNGFWRLTVLVVIMCMVNMAAAWMIHAIFESPVLVSLTAGYRRIVSGGERQTLLPRSDRSV